MACLCWKGSLIFIVVTGVILAALVSRLTPSASPINPPENTYWGPKTIQKGSAAPKDDETIHKFTVEYGADLISKLKEDIKNSVWVDPLENAAYHDGVNLKTFRDLMEHWRTKFDFQKSLSEINAYQHYKTEIEGLKIHFLRSPAKPKSANVKVIPLMLIHGWPGSFVEFLYTIPLLNEARDNIAFDIVVPSLPGYGFSDAPSRHGVDCVVTARIFKKLMARLGYSRYFVQGGDWGSAVTASMGLLYPEDVRGIHLNLLSAFPKTPKAIVKQILLRTCPDCFGDGQRPACLGLESGSFKRKLQEFGYYHMQATKPDTLGLAHLNSPVGLAAHILEKFPVATDPKFLDLDDGGFGRRIPTHHVLTNLMVYYTSRSAISSYRFYKENMLTGNMFSIYENPITVPTGYAIFPNDMACAPEFIARDSLPNLTSITYQKEGGHFAAMEVPNLLADDIRQFVKKVVELYPEK